jgi:acid phosphatase (class A)
MQWLFVRRFVAWGAMTAATCALAQQLEAQPRPANEPRPPPYLAEPVDFRSLLPPPPRKGSRILDEDPRQVAVLQDASDERFKAAAFDSRYLLPRFNEAFGEEIDRRRIPETVRLLNRTIRDVVVPTFAAKDHFLRTRPYQDTQLRRVCGAEKAPAPIENPKERSSYPSGHSAYGWAVAMVLARVKPERTEALMQRAVEYGESRIICGMHYPSDVEAGRVVAAAVVSRLWADAGFRADLDRARVEIAAR